MLHLDAHEREELAALCRRYGFARLGVFGSVARGDGRADSDVDVLYELLPGRHLTWDIEDAADELAALFGRPVDLVSRRALHPLLRDKVEAETAALYAA